MSYYETHKDQWKQYRENRIARLGGMDAYRVDRNARTQKYRRTRRSHHLALRRMAYAANVERYRATRVAYYRRNRVIENARTRARYWTDPAKARQRVLAYQKRQRALGRKQYSTRMGLNTLYSNRRTARLKRAGGSHTAQEWREKCALLANLCIYCGEARPLVRDHKVPLSRGGTDDITNIVPACRSCNSKKRSQTAHEYLGLVAA